MDNLDQKEWILDIRKGMELQVYISQDISDDNYYMHQAYRQALRAVTGIVQRSKKFYEKTQCVRNCSSHIIEDELFTYGSNVIAFAAQRGGGKTRTMLSFSHALAGRYNENLGQNGTKDRFLSDEDAEILRDAKFLVVPPISPSTLEEKQNILYVILTRLYRYVDELIESNNSRACFADYGCTNKNLTLETKWKDELACALQECFAGIRGVKRKTDDMSSDLMELQNITDGLALCRSFFGLVSNIVRFAGGPNSYLVLQLDDADSQINNGYEVLEDVRKYLQIPNLIILISADMELMHDAIRQDYQRQFPSRENDVEFQKRITRMCRKYIDKLIPPTHMVNLPQLDIKMEQYAQFLHVKYVDEKKNEVFSWADGLDLQDMLLMLIYRKTRVVFVKPTSYPHNILPTTMRGLNQILQLLSKMEDIPQIESDRENFSTPQKLAQAVHAQASIEEDNLERFWDYFINDWIRVKITDQGSLDFLSELSSAVSARYIPMTIDYLCKKYNLKNENHRREQLYLDDLMVKLEATNSSQNDYYLLFAIRTLFTLNHHRMILRERHKALAVFMKKPRKYFLVDYNPSETFLPRNYLVNENISALSLGKAESVSKAMNVLAEHQGKVKNLEMIKNQAEGRFNKAREDRDEACRKYRSSLSDLDDAKFEELDARNQWNIEKAQLAAVEESLREGRTAQERLALVNARKAEAGARIAYEAAREYTLSMESRKKDAEDALKDKNANYDQCAMVLQVAEHQLDVENANKDTYSKSLKVYGDSVDVSNASEIAHPVFAVRNALKDTWGEQRKVDKAELTPDKFSGKELLYNCMVSTDAAGHLSVNYLSFVTFLLRLGAEGAVVEKQGSSLDPVEFQMRLYMAQECALVIAANWDVQNKLYKKLYLGNSTKNKVKFRDLFQAVDQVLHTEVNDGRLYEFHKIITPTGADSDLPDYWSISSGFLMFEAEGKYSFLSGGDRMQFLCEIFDVEWKQPKLSSNDPRKSESNTNETFRDMGFHV